VDGGSAGGDDEERQITGEGDAAKGEAAGNDGKKKNGGVT